MDRVVDGDTAKVFLGGRSVYVRYIGIDTPESVAPDRPVECGGPEASEFNRNRIEGRTVRLVFDRERYDRYDRLLAYVFVGDRLLNAEILREGLAETLTIPPNDAYRERFARAEESARRAKKGIWGTCRY